LQRRIDVALLAAMPKEIQGLADWLTPLSSGSVGGESFVVGSFQTLTVLLGSLGFGKVNAAATLATLAERFQLAQVWHLGCAGAYPDCPPRIGDVLVTTEFVCGDEGILTAGGTVPQSAIGIPIVVANGEDYHDRLPATETLLAWCRALTPAGCYQLDSNWSPQPVPRHDPGQSMTDPESRAAELATHRHGFELIYGPSVTVSLISGDETVANDRFLRYRAWGENMEGSAVAQTCLRLGIPVLECRGISNRAGQRDKEQWRMDEALAHCHALVHLWLTSLPSALDGGLFS
jgi:futalosine hydrolase